MVVFAILLVLSTGASDTSSRVAAKWVSADRLKVAFWGKHGVRLRLEESVTEKSVADSIYID